MLKPCDFLVLGDISTFGLNRESMTRNIPLVLRPTRNVNTTLSTINQSNLACLYSFLQPNIQMQRWSPASAGVHRSCRDSQDRQLQSWVRPYIQS